MSHEAGVGAAVENVEGCVLGYHEAEQAFMHAASHPGGTIPLFDPFIIVIGWFIVVIGSFIVTSFEGDPTTTTATLLFYLMRVDNSLTAKVRIPCFLNSPHLHSHQLPRLDSIAPRTVTDHKRAVR